MSTDKAGDEVSYADALTNGQKTSDYVKTSAFAVYEKSVALTFDDGPGYKTTMTLLDGLLERGVKATFFVVGSNIEMRNEVIIRMHNEGHMIGNHTYSHVELTKVNLEFAVKEITDTNRIIFELTGEYPRYIRPPYGEWNDEIETQVDMTPVFWTLDTDDWSGPGTYDIVKYVLDNVEDGDIILFHDIYDTSVTAALEVIDQLKMRGYNFVTVDELILE